jgi:hypothetical protein
MPERTPPDQHDDMPKEEVARRIREARERAGYETAYAAGKAAGFPVPQSYYHFETGNRCPSFQAVHRLISVAGYDPAILFAPYTAPRGRKAKGLHFDGRGGRKDKPSPETEPPDPVARPALVP